MYKATTNSFSTTITLGPESAIGSKNTTNTTQATSIYIQNPNLHQWNSSEGAAGMSYFQPSMNVPSRNKCAPNCTTAFQDMIRNVSVDDSLRFGLDFRDSQSTLTSISSQKSSMQMGGVKEEYKDTVVVTYQANPFPQYHEFFLQGLSMCGVNLLQNYSNTWQVTVDTSCVCVQLPGPLYEVYRAWVNDTYPIEDIKTLPALSFALNDESDNIFYIPLSSLLINASVFYSEKGAINVTVKDAAQPQALCVLKGADVDTSEGSSSPDNVFLGTLALQSIYFSADFSSGAVGLANKLLGSEINSMQNEPSTDSVLGMCSIKPECMGKQSYHESSNTCSRPTCHKFFFTELDESTNECVWNSGIFIGGLIFVILIAAAEVTAYLVIQHSVSELHLGLRESVEGGVTYQRVALGEPDVVTKTIGGALGMQVDELIKCCNTLCCTRCGPVVPLPEVPHGDAPPNHVLHV